MTENTSDKHILPDASYGTILGVLERMADVAGIAPRKRITGGRQYAFRNGPETWAITLTEKRIRTRIRNGKRITAKGTMRFPLSGKVIVSYSLPSSAVIIKAADGMTFIVTLPGSTKAAMSYIADGTIPETGKRGAAAGTQKESPEPDTHHPFSVIQDADVPPMESFGDYGKPYPRGRRTRPSDAHKAITGPDDGRRKPFYRRNGAIIARARGKHVDVYTDGGVRPEEGSIGGWAFTVLHNEDVAAMEAGAVPKATITRMELLAAVKALNALMEISPLEATVYTDSQYVRNGAEIWWKGWVEKNGRIRPAMKDSDLWQELVDTREYLRKKGCDVTFEWIKGHSGNRWNTFVDRKNKEAMDTRRKHR